MQWQGIPTLDNAPLTEVTCCRRFLRATITASSVIILTAVSLIVLTVATIPNVLRAMDPPVAEQ